MWPILQPMVTHSSRVYSGPSTAPADLVWRRWSSCRCPVTPACSKQARFIHHGHDLEAYNLLDTYNLHYLVQGRSLLTELLEGGREEAGEEDREGKAE